MKRIINSIIFFIILIFNFIPINLYAIGNINEHPSTLIYPYYVYFTAYENGIELRDVYYFNSDLKKPNITKLQYGYKLEFDGGLFCEKQMKWNGQWNDLGNKIISNYTIYNESRYSNVSYYTNMIGDENYYVRDEIELLDDNFTDLLLSEEKYWEMIGLQYFVLAYKDNMDGQKKILDYAKSKQGTGHGSFVIGLGLKDDNTLDVSLSLSRSFLSHGPYKNPHKRYFDDFVYQFNFQSPMECLPEQIHWLYYNFVNKEKDFKTTNGQHAELPLKIISTSGYTLKYQKLSYCDNIYTSVFPHGLHDIDLLHDIFGFVDEKPYEIFDGLFYEEPEINLIYEDNHVWFYNDGIPIFITSPTPTNNFTPTPTKTPMPYKSPAPTSNNYTPMPIIEPPGAGIKWPSVTDEVYKKMPVGLIGSLYRLKELKTSPVPPVVSVNLYKLTKPISDRFHTGNNFEDKETKILDFALLNDDIKFIGIGIVTWFRSVLGALFIWFTIGSFRERLTPKEPLGG